MAYPHHQSHRMQPHQPFQQQQQNNHQLQILPQDVLPCQCDAVQQLQPVAQQNPEGRFATVQPHTQLLPQVHKHDQLQSTRYAANSSNQIQDFNAQQSRMYNEKHSNCVAMIKGGLLFEFVLQVLFDKLNYHGIHLQNTIYIYQNIVICLLTT